MQNVYDRLAAVSDQLKVLGQFDLVNELNSVCDEIAMLDGADQEIKEWLYGVDWRKQA